MASLRVGKLFPLYFYISGGCVERRLKTTTGHAAEVVVTQLKSDIKDIKTNIVVVMCECL